MQQALAVECNQPPLHPPPSSSPKFAAGLQQELAPELLIPPISSGEIDRETEREKKI
jgi:hypothetical protein